MTTASEFIATRSQVASFLQSGRFKRQADANAAAETLMAFIADGTPFPVAEQIELPLVASSAPSATSDDEDE